MKSSNYKQSLRKWYHLRADSITGLRGRRNYVQALQNHAPRTYSAIEILALLGVSLHIISGVIYVA